MHDARPLYALDGVGRFSDRAGAYARGRPSYPVEAVRWIAGSGHSAAPLTLDVGAGTGIGARLLDACGARVVALDPNEAMIAAGRGVNFGRAVFGHGEILPFATAVFDLVTVFNAFHWLTPSSALPELRRVLRANGLLAVVWNDWNHSDAFTDAFVRLMRSYAGDHPPEDRDGEVAPLYRCHEFASIERRDFPNVHVMNRSALHDRIGSVGYIPRGEPYESEIRRGIDDMYDRYAGAEGTVTHHYTTCVFLARPSTEV